MAAVTNLPWRGVETIEAARAALAAKQSVELHLPAGFHHAVYAHFRRELESAEQVDVSGGVELLQRLAEIRGLDPLADLEPSITQAHAAVRVLSPSPTVLITLEGSGAGA